MATKRTEQPGYKRLLEKRKERYHNDTEYREYFKNHNKQWYQDHKRDINFRLRRAAYQREYYHLKKIKENGKEVQVDSAENTGV